MAWRCDPQCGNASARGAHLDGGNARNDIRRTDGDKELVRAGGHLLKHIFASDVRPRRHREGRRQQTEEKKPHASQDNAPHRCTPRIQRPKTSPIQVEIAA